jgi:trimeric autotransporter adhesin
MKKLYFLIVLLIFNVHAFGQLTLNNTLTPTQLVNNVLLGSGVTASNITYTGAAISRASFTCGGACNLGVSDGILLSTGEATAPTSPASYHHSTDVNAAGDAQLDAIVFPRLTEDAAILEFDFSVASDSVKFEYVFASEEYNDYANTNFNDVFAFFISGPGIAGAQNIAIIPNSSTPVSINTVNNGNSGGVSSGPCMNCQYFVDNVGGASVYYDGFTTVLTAKAAVHPCEVYHIKLAIADAGDGIFDSGVFLKGGSFSSLGDVAIIANGIPQPTGGSVYACTGTSVNLCLNPAANYNWSTGATTQCINVDEQNLAPNGDYQAFVLVNTCFVYTEVHVQFVTPSATITASGPLNLCPGNNVTLTANVGNTYLWSTGATTQSISVSTAGTYTVTVSNGPNCSAVSTPVAVTVGNATAQITGVLSLCSGASTTLTANAAQSYLWNTGATTASIPVTTAGNYTVTVTQAGGCTATATAIVQVNSNPVPVITGTLSICQGQNTVLSPGPGFSTYSWSGGAATPTLSVTTSGTYTVTVTNAAGCSGSTSASVVVHPLPVPAITGTTAFCSGASSTISATGGFASYLWNTSAVTSSISVTTAGTYTVTVTDAFSCSATTSTPITVNPLPVPNITGTFAFCQGSNTGITPGAGFASYLWNTGAVTPTLTVSSANTYTVTVTDANGCTGSDSQVITVNPNPAPSITGVTAICQGANTIFTAPLGFSSYSWSTGAVSPTVSLNTAGTYSVTVTDANGCSGSTSANLVVNPLPVPSITGNTTFCSGGNSNISVGNGFASYLWNTGAVTSSINVTASGTYTATVTNGNGCTGSTNVAIVVNPLPAPNISGTFAFCQGASSIITPGPNYASYLWNTGAVSPSITVSSGNTYTVTVTDANGCSNSDSQLITVNANPVPAITGTNVICQGASTTFSGPPGFTTYSWSTGAASANVNLNTAGTYTLTVTDANGCSGTTSANLTVNPLPVPAITGVTSFCQGGNSNLNAGGGFSSYLWNTGAITQQLNVTATGNYIVTVTNAFSCSATTSAQVTVNPNPAPAISGPTAFCIGNNVNLNAGGGYASYLWNTGATTQIINTTAGGTYTVTVTSGAGCTGTTNTSLTVNPLPVPVITGVTSICQGATTILDAGAGFSSYLWSTGATSATITTGAAGPVTVTVTDANGCSSPASSNVTVNPLPLPVITGVNAFCQGGSSTLDAGTGFSSYLWNTGAVSRTITVSAGGNYTVTVTASTGCAGNDNQLVTVHPNPVPVITGGTGICQGASTTLNAGGGYSSYLWSTGDNTQQIPVSAAGNYTVTVTSAFGCIGSAITSMVVNPLPTPNITGVTSICQGTTTSFDAGSGYNAYSWSNGSTSQTITPGTAGSYTVTVTDNNGCSNSDVTSLTVNPLPVPAITGTTAFCQGANSNINAGGGFVNYLWNGGQTTQVINVTTAGNYIVTVTDNNGCTGTTNTQITVHPNPLPVINGGTGICQGTSTTLNVPGSYATYLWSTGDVTPSISVSTAGNFSVTVSSAFGCTGSTSTAMVINALPTPAITGVTSICQGTVTTFDAGSGYNSYLWSNGSTSQTISPGTAGIYTVTVTDANGCNNDTDISLVVNALPVPAISGDLQLCQGDNSNLTATGGYSNYLWNTGAATQLINVNTAGNYAVTVTDNNGCTGTISSAVVVNPLPNPVISGATAICQGNTTSLSTGAYASYIWSDGTTANSITVGTAGTYSVTVTDNNGCINSTSASLTVYALPTAALSGTAAICVGQSTSLNVNFTGTAPFSYSYFNGTNTVPGSPVTGTTATFNVAPGTTTSYVLMTVSDAHCAGTIAGSAATVTVNPLPQPVITGDMFICDGETTSLNATPGFAAYSWSTSGTQPNLLTGTAGIYTVTVTDNNGCVGTSPAVNLVVNSVPVVAFTNDTSLTCAVPQINFTNLSTYDPGSVFTWNFGDGLSSSEINPSHLFFTPGNYPISLQITTPAGCTSSSTNFVDIMFFPLPEADFVTAPAVTNVFNGKVSFVDRSANAISWYWLFGDGAFSTEQNPEHYYSEIGDYKVTLRVTNIAGCEDYSETPVTINPFYIPNAFTPNADGVNDVFYYSGYDLDVASYNMKIFNRWGELVFTGSDENDNWNGETNSGKQAPQGTYIYRLQVKTKAGKDYTFNGQVSLIR